MNFKHIVIVSLILTIMTIGVVSASQDVVADEQTSSDITDNPIEEVPDDEAIEETENSQPASEIKPTDFNVHTVDSIDLNDENKILINFTVPEDANGKIDVYMDSSSPIYSKDISPGQVINITADDLNIKSSDNYPIKLVYVPNSGDGFTIAEYTLDAYYEEDFQITIENDATTIDPAVVSIYKIPVNGTLTIFVNGKSCYSEKTDDTYYKGIHFSELNMSEGKYNVSVKYVVDNTLKEFTWGPVEVLYEIDWTWDMYLIPEYELDITNYDSVLFIINTYEALIKGTVYVYIDGKLIFTKEMENDGTYYRFSAGELKLFKNATVGNHSVKIIYMENNFERHEIRVVVNFYAPPQIEYPSLISVGENEFLTVNCIGATGVATIYEAVKKYDESSMGYIWIKGNVSKSVNIVNGIASFPLNSLPKGENHFIVNVSTKDYNIEENVSVEVNENTGGFSSSISATEILVGGNGVVVSFDSSIDDVVNAYIYLDDQEIKQFSLRNGSFNETISGLSVGRHKISVKSYTDFYSKTFYVTVKPVPVVVVDKITLTLKKVKVKKSAKKLIIQASLKINGKVVKGKVIKFKFMNKSYKAKTDKKGIAKITINKKILKKLKVGKKINYQASYDKNNIVKKTVKVKK